MDLCNRFNVNGQCSLYVTGIEGVYTDDDITKVFEINGKVSKVARIPNEPNEVEGRVLIEYVSDKSISKIDPKILGDLPSPNDPSVVWSVRTIREVVQEDVGREIARRYLSELKAVGSSGKTGFFSVLQSELHESHTTTYHTQPGTALTSDTSNHDMLDSQAECTEPARTPSTSASASLTAVPIDESLFNPPQIQKVVVEHVIRSEVASSSSAYTRIRTFSGRTPRPSGEVDYEIWRTQVGLLLSDPALSDAQKVKKILESLLSPAADTVKHLGVSSLASTYVAQLDSAFGVVEDGEELFAAFLSSNQNNGEKPSAYLNRLHSLLTRAVSRGGATTGNPSELLLRQFCRGCWDQSLIIGLQLEYKKDNPPSFPELLLMLRSEEDRRSAKLDRMKKHLGVTKAAAHAHSIYDMSAYDHEPVSSDGIRQSETSKLEKRVSELAKQVEKLNQKSKNPIKTSEPQQVPNSQQSGTTNIENKIDELTKQVQVLVQSQKFPKRSQGYDKQEGPAVHRSNLKKSVSVPGMPRAWFCFKCGEDGHIAACCLNEPDPALVREKNAELRERQEKFKAQQASAPFGLNL